MGKDEIANLLDSMLDKELEDLDSLQIMIGGNWRKIWMSISKEFKCFIELMSEYVFPGIF